jgi:hypothetical protein
MVAVSAIVAVYVTPHDPALSRTEYTDMVGWACGNIVLVHRALLLLAE